MATTFFAALDQRAFDRLVPLLDSAGRQFLVLQQRAMLAEMLRVPSTGMSPRMARRLFGAATLDEFDRLPADSVLVHRLGIELLEPEPGPLAPRRLLGVVLEADSVAHVLARAPSPLAPDAPRPFHARADPSTDLQVLTLVWRRDRWQALLGGSWRQQDGMIGVTDEEP